MLFRHRSFTAVLGTALLCFAGTPAAAQVTNGGFETGDFTGWSGLGDIQIETASLGTGPTEGIYDALLATVTDAGGSVSAGTGDTPSNLEGLLNLAPGSLLGIGNGTPVLGSGKTSSSTDVSLIPGTGPGNKLQEGAYILAAPNLNLTGYGYSPSKTESPVVNLEGGSVAPYVLITIDQA